MLSLGIALGAVKCLLDRSSLHLVFRDKQGDIYELSWKKNGGWNCKKVTEEDSNHNRNHNGLGFPKAACDPVAFASASGVEYIYYYSNDSFIYQLYRNHETSGKKWKIVDITSQVHRLDQTTNKFTKLEPTGDLICWTILGTHHIFFHTTDGHIHEFSCLHTLPYVPSSGWKHRDLTLDLFAGLASTYIPFNPLRQSNSQVLNTMIEGDEEDDFKFLEDHALYPQFPHFQVDSFAVDTLNDNNIYNRMKGGEGMDNESMDDLNDQEQSLMEQLNKLKSGVYYYSGKTEDQLLKSIQVIQDKKYKLKEFEDTHKFHQLINQYLTEHFDRVTCGISGHSAMGTQNVVFYTTQNHKTKLCVMRWAGVAGTISKGSNQTSNTEEEYEIKEVERKMNELMKTSSPKKMFNDWLYKTYDMVNSWTTCWSLTNISELKGILPPDIRFFGNPVSHSGTSGSLYIFLLDYPNFHLHCLTYSVPSGKWSYENITISTNTPPVAPMVKANQSMKAEQPINDQKIAKGALHSQTLLSFSSSVYHFVYFIDQFGEIHELKQSQLSSQWEHINITKTLTEIPVAKKLLTVTSLPLNKHLNSTVIYYLDNKDHIVELVCQWSLDIYSKPHWTFSDLYSERRIAAEAPSPIGKVSTYSRGIFEGFSSTAMTGLTTAINYVSDTISGAPKQSYQSDLSSSSEEITPNHSDHVLLTKLERKLKEETERFIEQAEANQKLQLQLIDLQNQYKQSRKFKEEQAVAEQRRREYEEKMTKLNDELKDNSIKLEQTESLKMEIECQLGLFKDQLEAERAIRQEKEYEAMNAMKQQEELKKKQQESDHLVHILTGGFSVEVYKKVHNIGGNEEDNKARNTECVICLDEPPVCELMPCHHKVLCTRCYQSLKQKTCPICQIPIQSCSISRINAALTG